MIILCTHHKGGVGKTELAIHVAGVLREQIIGQTLLVDCDSQASAWKFYVPSPPSGENDARKVDGRLSVMWNPRRERIKKEDLESYDHFVLDIDTPLQNAVQVIVQNEPDRVLIPVNPQAGALTELDDPLSVLAQLEGKLRHPLKVRIVPLGAKLADIRRRLNEIAPGLRDCEIVRRVRNLHTETNLARLGRYYIWEHQGCEDLKGYYGGLVNELLA